MRLNKKQSEFIELVKSGEKHILVNAPAGTGKTFSCIQAAFAICEGKTFLEYQKVLILTFSRNARAQLLKELQNISEESKIYKHIEINNYHSFFKKYINSYRNILGIQQAISIIDNEDFLEGVYDYAKKINIKLKEKLNCSILDDFSIVNEKINKLNFYAKKITEKDVKAFIDITTQYTQITGKICFAQFGSMICKIVNLSPSIVSAIGHDYPTIILDEYQDTNYYQEYFLRMLLKYSNGIFFADEIQMIYEFRGSSNQRIVELKNLYPDLKTITFDEYFRYKNKPDLIKILTNIRINKHNPLDYSELTNGKFISINIPCNSNWETITGKTHTAQCTIFCKYIYYGIVGYISKELNKNKSIVILCRRNEVVKGLFDMFWKNNICPHSITDSSEMLGLSKALKKYFSSQSISDAVPHLLTIIAYCTMTKSIDGDTIEKIKEIKSIGSKKGEQFKQINIFIKKYKAYKDTDNYKKCLKEILQWFQGKNKKNINYVRYRYVEHCLKFDSITNELIENIMLKRQYLESFTNISPGLYITTIHQAKGREFDSVFVIDIDLIMCNQTLLYVSHSRMREKLFPVKIHYSGFNLSEMDR